MIAAVHGKGGAGGACDYVFERKKEEKEPTILGGTLAGRDGREVRAELEALTGLRPDVERGVFHGSLSAAPGEQPTPAQWGEMAARWMERLKLDSYVVVQHYDAEHAHVHVLAARITPAGRVISDAYDALKSQEVAREIEQAYQLARVPASWEKGAERAERALTKGEAGRAERLGQEPYLIAVRRGAGEDFQQATSWEDLTRRLERHGLMIQPGKKGAGLVVTDGHETVKASDVGRDYSRGNLEKRLGGYEQFIERQQQRAQQRAEPARLIERLVERGVEQQRGEAGRIQERYAAERAGPAGHPEITIPGAARGDGPGAGREFGRPGEPGRDVPDRAAGAARGGAGDDRERGRGGADRGARLHDGGREGDGRAAGLQGAERGAGRGEGDRGAVGPARTELGGAAPLPDVGGRGGDRAGAVAPLGAPVVGEVGDRGRAADERGAAAGDRDRRPGDPALPGPANSVLAAVRDRGGDGLAAPGAGPLPTDRAGIERALIEARQQLGLHTAADRAGQAHADAYARLYRDPAGARRQVEALARSSMGPEIAADVLRRTPQKFGVLTDEAARQVAGGWGRDLTDAIGKTGQVVREAEALRPRVPGDQLSTQAARLDGLLEPFRVQDRAQERARGLQRALERGLGLGDRDRGRGGMGR